MRERPGNFRAKPRRKPQEGSGKLGLHRQGLHSELLRSSVTVTRALFPQAADGSELSYPSQREPSPQRQLMTCSRAPTRASLCKAAPTMELCVKPAEACVMAASWLPFSLPNPALLLSHRTLPRKSPAHESPSQSLFREQKPSGEQWGVVWDHSTQWFGLRMRRREPHRGSSKSSQEAGGSWGPGREGRGEGKGHRGTQKGCLEKRVVMAS